MRHNQREELTETNPTTTTMSICDLERQGEIALLTPTENLGELVYDEFEAVVRTTLDMLNGGDVKHVIIDFHHTKYFGSRTITSLLKLGNTTRSLGGKMALARLSVQEKEILKATKLDTFWPMYSSREEATEAVGA